MPTPIAYTETHITPIQAQLMKNPHLSSKETRHFPPSESISSSLACEEEEGCNHQTLLISGRAFQPYKRHHKCQGRLLPRPLMSEFPLILSLDKE